MTTKFFWLWFFLILCFPISVLARDRFPYASQQKIHDDFSGTVLDGGIALTSSISPAELGLISDSDRNFSEVLGVNTLINGSRLVIIPPENWRKAIRVSEMWGAAGWCKDSAIVIRMDEYWFTFDSLNHERMHCLLHVHHEGVATFLAFILTVNEAFTRGDYQQAAKLETKFLEYQYDEGHGFALMQILKQLRKDRQLWSASQFPGYFNNLIQTDWRDTGVSINDLVGGPETLKSFVAEYLRTYHERFTSVGPLLAREGTFTKRK